MASSAQYEIYSIKQELQSIINELEDIAAGIHRDFEGIGNEQCARSIDNLADHYRYAMRKLNNIDTSRVSEEFAK